MLKVKQRLLTIKLEYENTYKHLKNFWLTWYTFFGLQNKIIQNM